MDVGPVGLVVMLFSFVLTFIVARTVAKWFWSRRDRKVQEKARAAETRQVRRARERRSGR
ncbi:MAG: hypothetical protein HY854_12585 [Burkholderiales bacterium]|nr:hypothetical protein [Burkholderiales bacterium]